MAREVEIKEAERLRPKLLTYTRGKLPINHRDNAEDIVQTAMITFSNIEIKEWDAIYPTLVSIVRFDIQDWYRASQQTRNQEQIYDVTKAQKDKSYDIVDFNITVSLLPTPFQEAIRNALEDVPAVSSYKQRINLIKAVNKLNEQA